MISRKDLIIVVLFGFILAVTIYPKITVSQEPPHIPHYDPWIDLDDSGCIDVFDAVILSGAAGTTGDPTKNVIVTNFPEDRPPTIKKGIEKIVVLNTLSYERSGYGEGICLTRAGISFSFDCYYIFEPKPEIVNVTNIYINVVWRGDQYHAMDTYQFVMRFWNASYFDFEDVDIAPTALYIQNYATYVHFNVSNVEPDFNFGIVTEGLNRLEFFRAYDEFFTESVYIFKLELFIEYYYLGRDS